jgi:hypothetical protein
MADQPPRTDAGIGMGIGTTRLSREVSSLSTDRGRRFAKTHLCTPRKNSTSSEARAAAPHVHDRTKRSP